MATTTTNTNNVVANNTVANKEENVMMMNNTTVKELRKMAKEAGIKGYSKMNKADLIAALAPTAPTTVEVSVGDLSITKDTMAVEVKEDTMDQKKKEKNRVALSLVVAWIYQSTHSVTKDNRVLFYVPTKRTDLNGVKISSRRRLSKVTGDLLGWMYGKELKGDTFRNWVDSAYDVAIEAGLCHKNGNDIHMSVEEWNRCVTLYSKDFMKDSIKKYAAFVATIANKKQ